MHDCVCVCVYIYIYKHVDMCSEMVNELNQQTIISKFELHWYPQTPGLVPYLF